MWCVYIHIWNRILFSDLKNYGIASFAATWMVLEEITVSEVSQRKTNTVYYH